MKMKAPDICIQLAPPDCVFDCEVCGFNRFINQERIARIRNHEMSYEDGKYRLKIGGYHAEQSD